MFPICNKKGKMIALKWWLRFTPKDISYELFKTVEFKIVDMRECYGYRRLNMTYEYVYVRVKKML